MQQGQIQSNKWNQAINFKDAQRTERQIGEEKMKNKIRRMRMVKCEKKGTGRGGSAETNMDKY